MYAFTSASVSVAPRAQTLATRPATLLIFPPRGVVRLPREDAPLARREPVALHPRGIPHLLERGAGLVGRAARDGLGGRNRVLPHELFREDLGAFELRGQAGGAEDREAALLELVDDAEGERKLGADDGEVHLQPLGEVGELDDVGHADVDAVGHRGDAGVPWGRVKFSDQRGLLEFPRDRVLARALPDDESPHESPSVLTGAIRRREGGGEPPESGGSSACSECPPPGLDVSSTALVIA